MNVAAMPPTVSADTTLLEKRRELKRRLTSGEFQTLGDIVYGQVSQLIVKLIRSSTPIPLWVGAMVLLLLHLLIDYWLLRLDGNAVLQEYLLILLFSSVLAHAGVLLYALQYRALFATMRDHLVDAILSPADLADLKQWLAVAGSRKYVIALSLPLALVVGLFFTSLLTTVRESKVGLGTTIASCLNVFVYGMVLYYLLALVNLPFHIGRYDFKLYAIKPGSSELVARLSELFGSFAFQLAVYATVFTLLIAYVGVLNTAGFVFVLLAWIPLVGLFAANQNALSRIIARAKWRTLHEIQTRIETIAGEENLTDKETIESLNRLMDYHDRIEGTRRSALDLRAILTFVNSLLLPLLAFLLANEARIVALFR
jgi:hypothetical protein